MINDSRTNNNNHLVQAINNQSFKINDLKVQLIQKIEDENVSLAFQVSSLVKEREHIKLEYKKLYDSIKQTQAKTNFRKVIPKVVGKNDLSKSVTSHLTTNKIIEKCIIVLAPGFLKTESEPINAYFKNNKAVHKDYLKVTKEHVATLHELLEEARALKPLDKHIGHAFKFDERIQELLVQLSTQKHAVKQNTRKTDNTMLPSIGRVSSTNTSGSKPRSNTKNDRIPQPLSRSMKNKLEAHHRKFESSANKNNYVLDCNANVKNVALLKNSDTICLSCNKCLFFANHDACVVQYLKKM
ncbi:hypothetical protein Tco_1315229 [Tanacetum coccineum]